MAQQLFPHQPAKQAGQLQPLVLAYVGDAIYELYVRQYLISLSNHRPHQLHRSATKYVSARAQAKALHQLMPILTEDELNIVKRGRNAKSGTAPKNADVMDYRYSTAFECLLGYLYYNNEHERLEHIMQITVASISTQGGS